MQKIDFKNYPNTTTPINATNLNAIQDNVEGAISDAVSILSTGSSIGSFTIGNKIGVEFGVVEFSISSTSSSTTFGGSMSVTFSNSYSSVPGVFTSWATSYLNDLDTYAIQKTTTGCTVGGHTSSSSTSTRKVGYLVVGFLADTEGE